MFGGLNRTLPAALVAGAALTVVLAGPSAALACNSSTSAVNVYKECLPSGGGAKPTSGGPSSSPTGSSANSTSPGYSSQTAKALSKAGKDEKALAYLVKSYGLRRRLQASNAGSASTPSALGSAFDLGSGPTALLVVLAGTAVLLLGGSGMRVWRNRHGA